MCLEFPNPTYVSPPTPASPPHTQLVSEKLTAAIGLFVDASLPYYIDSSMEPSDNGPTLVAVVWALEALALIVVGLRLYVRIVLTKAAGRDDWTMLLALVWLSDSFFLRRFLLTRHIGS